MEREIGNCSLLKSIILKIKKTMTSKEEQINSENIDELKESFQENDVTDELKDLENEYKFGWSSYSEVTNGRFAMLGFLAIVLIELFSKQSFLEWAGIL